MHSKKITIDGIGEVLLERSVRARYVNLSVRPFRGIRVAVPPGISFQKAAQVARSKADWLRQMLERTSRLEKQVMAFSNDQSFSREGAKQLLVSRLQQLAVRHGFKYNRVFIRHQQTRWGSCSYKNNINLNVNLVYLPDALIDYVILHELVHTRIKNHSADFWKELEKYFQDPKQVDKELDRYWPLIHSCAPGDK